MSDLVDDLAEVLSAQTTELRALLPLLDEQQAALLRADSRQVAELLGRQEALIARLLKLEKRRRAAVVALAAQLGLEPRHVTISALLALVPRAATVLGALRDELRRLVTTLDRLSRRNAFLLDRVMTYVDGLVRTLMAGAAEPLPLYVASGRTTGLPPTAARLVDRRA